MTARRTAIIVNPRSGNGRTARQWPHIERKLTHALGPVTSKLTETPNHATALTRNALNEGYDLIVAVGGDGTLNEVVNGFFHNGVAINTKACLGLIPAATGGDFRRTFHIPRNVDQAIARLKNATERRIDLGRMTFQDHDGVETTQYFANSASLGLGGIVARAVNDSHAAKFVGGRMAFFWHSLRHALVYKNTAVRLVIDHGSPQTLVINTICLCNGQYTGGGMRMAPNAQPNDGYFDVVILGDLTKWEVLSNILRIYRGTHVNHRKVTVRRARMVSAEYATSDRTNNILLEMDGETPGHLPARFDIVPNALTLLC